MDKVTIRLLKHHTHEGVERVPGESIALYEDQATWLVSIGTAERVEAEDPKPSKKGPKAADKET